ncbi:c-type cytochrome [Pseudooceanicola nanhaiensis]|uniref:c-type cytochrome n=1 Tax=Pseudooceanicola nanhaiensis TaxID=375761 RepID=UPI001CD7544D|nr:c-type cytochrome [Pseudooceanicola nanhaiensis]MCA0921939.1 c-type cytochrome [Pseudooceanicola nanhaiensis]
MASIKKIGAGVLGVAVIAAAGAGVWAYQTLNTSRSAVADDTITLAEFTSEDQDAIARGEYVMRAGDCAACHTRGAGDFAGGYEIATPFGTLVSSNITPDVETGIGAMTERDFFNAVRHGQGSEGMLYPAMPYTAYAKLTDQDMHDLWDYMSTVAPVSNPIDENGGMRFPYNQRLAMAGWNMLFFDNAGFDGDPETERGRYLVDGAGHCSACHSPRNELGAEMASAYLEGGVVDGWYAPDLTQNPHVGLGGSTAEEIADYLRTGSDGISVAAGPMAEAVEHSLQYLTQEDALAVGSYLTSLKASDVAPVAPLSLDTAEMQRAADDYEVNCSACHGLAGEGITGMVPAFAGNKAMLSDPSGMIHAMLKGARAPHTGVRQTAAGMPSFAWKMSDAQVAEILTYVRNNWGNGATAVNPAQVAQMREELGAREKIGAPSH